MAMKILTGPRRSGKTTELIKLCAESEKNGESSVIVCPTMGMAERVQRLAKDLGYDVQVTYPNILRGMDVKNVFVNDAEYVLNTYLVGSIQAITVTTEQEQSSMDRDRTLSVKSVIQNLAFTAPELMNDEEYMNDWCQKYYGVGFDTPLKKKKNPKEQPPPGE